MEEHPSVGLVYGHPIHFETPPLPPARTTPTAWRVWPGRAWIAARCRSGYNVITSPEVVMRKSVVDVAGGQMPLAHTHDMEMWLRIAAFSDVAYIVGAGQAWHRDHQLSLSAREVDAFSDLQERYEAFDTLLRGVAAPVLDRQRPPAHYDQASRRPGPRVRGTSIRPGSSHGRNDRPGYRSFAVGIDSTARGSAQWRAVDRRQRLGRTARTIMAPWFTASAIRRRLRLERERHHWNRYGVYSDRD